MKVIGIVGGIGAGKSTVVSILESLCKVYIIGADEIGHQLLLPSGEAYHQVVETFGKEILDEDGYIMRKKLGEIVFSDATQLALLNGITHPLIYHKIKDQIAWCKNSGNWDYVMIDAALLIELGLVPLTDIILGVYTPVDIRINRIMQRNGCTKEETLKRIKMQKNWEELEKISTVIIDNSFTYENTKAQLSDIIRKW